MRAATSGQAKCSGAVLAKAYWNGQFVSELMRLKFTRPIAPELVGTPAARR